MRSNRAIEPTASRDSPYWRLRSLLIYEATVFARLTSLCALL